MAQPARPVLTGVAVGDSIGTLTIEIDRARLVEYAAASFDRNPIHWDERFARSVGLPDVIAHGMFTMGAAGELAARWAGGAQYVRGYSCRFTNPVVVSHDSGARVEVTGVVKKVDEAASHVVVELTATCEGTKVLAKALVTVEVAAA